MPPGIGYSREIPLAREGGPGTPEGGQKPGGLSPQEAVKILSLRVPERPSPTAIAPLPLLQSPGSMGAGAQGLDAFIEGIMRAFPGALPAPGGGFSRGPNPTMPGWPAPSGQSQGVNLPSPSPSAPPPPRVTPGDEGDRSVPGPVERMPGPSAPPVDVTPAPLPIPQPPAPSNPFAQTGRNPRLAEKYMPDFDIQSLF